MESVLKFLHRSVGQCSCLHNQHETKTLHGRVARQKPLVTENNINAHHTFSQKHWMDSQALWRITLWIDETDLKVEPLYLELNKHGPKVGTRQWKCGGVWGRG